MVDRRGVELWHACRPIDGIATDPTAPSVALVDGDTSTGRDLRSALERTATRAVLASSASPRAIRHGVAVGAGRSIGATTGATADGDDAGAGNAPHGKPEAQLDEVAPALSSALGLCRPRRSVIRSVSALSRAVGRTPLGGTSAMSASAIALRTTTASLHSIRAPAGAVVRHEPTTRAALDRRSTFGTGAHWTTFQGSVQTAEWVCSQYRPAPGRGWSPPPLIAVELLEPERDHPRPHSWHGGTAGRSRRGCRGGDRRRARGDPPRWHGRRTRSSNDHHARAPDVGVAASPEASGPVSSCQPMALAPSCAEGSALDLAPYRPGSQARRKH